MTSPPNLLDKTAPTANHLYHELIFDGNKAALEFWGQIPKNMKDAVQFSLPLSTSYRKEKQPIFSLNRVAKLSRAIRELHKHHQMLSPRVKQNLSLLENSFAAIEAGHQPVVLGGPGLIINKIATIRRFSQQLKAPPLMFMGDHDHEQKELTVVHLPSPGPRGITFSLPIPQQFRHSPMHTLPLPPKSWLEQVVRKIESTYHELITNSPRQQRLHFQENIQGILKLLQVTYTKATSLSDWTLLLWMQIVNHQEDSGILFQVFSHPTIRRLMLPAFEYLIQTKNRQRFISALNEAANSLQKYGYNPGIGIRPNTYVPFHLECPTTGCNRTRIDPILFEKAEIRITATCPKCKETHILETNATDPDLSNWQDYLSPRVDSRAFLIQSYTPITLHVGGAGETSYYAQVSPALRSLESVVPIFYRYTRIFYTNPWTLHLAKKLKQEQFTPLQLNQVQSYQSAAATGFSEKNVGVVCSLFAACEEYIQETFKQLLREEATLEEERNKAIINQRETSDSTKRQRLQVEIGRMTRHRQLLQTYQSQMFGRYAAERFGQEVSFAWIDIAMSLGPQKLFTKLSSHYHALTPASATYLIHESTP